MKKWVVLILLAGFWSCVTNEVDDVQQQDEKAEFNLEVPSDFSWSAIMQDVLLVNIVRNGEESFDLDSTVIELYSNDDELLDALTITRGTACFNVRIPAATKQLKLKTPANGKVMEFSALKRSLSFEIQPIINCNFNRDDADGDGLYDQFDADPLNPHVALQIASNQMNRSSAYFIFEDLWPAKGDFDFNDFILKSNFTWIRGNDNYITEITGFCEAQWDDSEFGMGFEIFEARGGYLIYLDDVIEEIEGAEESELIDNGFVVFTETKVAGKATKNFTVKIKNHSLTNFVCIPYLFRTENENHQIRPFGTPPTKTQKMDMFHSKDDASPRNWNWMRGERFKYPLAGDDAFYRTAEGHPWGVQFISKNFVPCAEMQSVITSYPKFKDWAESGGIAEKDWYNYPAAN